MDKIKEIVTRSKEWSELVELGCSFELAKKSKNEKVKHEKQSAREILSGLDTVYLNIRSLKPDKAIHLDRSNYSLVEDIDSFLAKNGFSHKFNYGAVIRYSNSLGFVVELGKLSKFQKYEVLRLSKTGESSRFEKFEVFTYFNKIREGLGDILRQHEITPSERLARIDIFRDFITRSIFNLIKRGSLPLARASESLSGSLMKQRKYYEREKDSRSMSGIKFWNTSATFIAYSKTLEALKKSDAYRNFYNEIDICDHEEIIRTEVRHYSTFALNALYPVFLDAIKERSRERMLQKLEQIEIKAFNSFLDAHPFVTEKGEKDTFIELLLRKDKVSTGYDEVEKLMSSFSTLTPRELFGMPAQREDVIEALLRTFFRLNMDPKKISSGDLAELQSKYDIKRRRKYLKETEILSAQKLSALLVADTKDYDAITKHFNRAQIELKYQLV